MITVGLKNNALILFDLMQGNTLGGSTDGIFHNKVMKLNNTQFELLKTKIKELGFDVYQSLCTSSTTYGLDFSCYLIK